MHKGENRRRKVKALCFAPAAAHSSSGLVRSRLCLLFLPPLPSPPPHLYSKGAHSKRNWHAPGTLLAEMFILLRHQRMRDKVQPFLATSRFETRPFLSKQVFKSPMRKGLDFSWKRDYSYGRERSQMSLLRSDTRGYRIFRR